MVVSDLKLFRLQGNDVAQLTGGAVALEKSLQITFEKNLDGLLGVRFLASEFVTEGGRMDTLGIDENGTPVIIEYKRSSNENVINQGLFYLNWLMGHRKDFEWLVMERFGKDEAKKVDWSGPRLICIAGDFTKYDEHAVKEMNRNIDLIRYRKFENDLLLLEQLTTASAKGTSAAPANGGHSLSGSNKGKYKSVSQQIEEAPPELRARYDMLDSYLMTLGDDVTAKATEFYVAYRRIKNFACVEMRNQLGRILVFVKVNPDTVALEQGFTRDVRKIGHFGTGDLEITIGSDADFERAKVLLDRAYNES
jgi:predicted transport protein